ncbi:hypothetical protein SAMN05518682_1202 [Cellulosimicrobium aquatile]|uniref:Uncharacterized protein n=1 Tax=Cellulosimicrobium aquatile TaxID=1612203 RepID=A0A1N6PYG3_9MICO|nr:hypothetical protein SAMN05518682_1202 [Cellulosimicrobium aquatile]
MARVAAAVTVPSSSALDGGLLDQHARVVRDPPVQRLEAGVRPEVGLERPGAVPGRERLEAGLVDLGLAAFSPTCVGGVRPLRTGRVRA